MSYKQIYTKTTVYLNHINIKYPKHKHKKNKVSDFDNFDNSPSTHYSPLRVAFLLLIINVINNRKKHLPLFDQNGQRVTVHVGW